MEGRNKNVTKFKAEKVNLNGKVWTGMKQYFKGEKVYQ